MVNICWKRWIIHIVDEFGFVKSVALKAYLIFWYFASQKLRKAAEQSENYADDKKETQQIEGLYVTLIMIINDENESTGTVIKIDYLFYS